MNGNVWIETVKAVVVQESLALAIGPCGNGISMTLAVYIFVLIWQEFARNYKFGRFIEICSQDVVHFNGFTWFCTVKHNNILCFVFVAGDFACNKSWHFANLLTARIHITICFRDSLVRRSRRSETRKQFFRQLSEGFAQGIFHPAFVTSGRTWPPSYIVSKASILLSFLANLHHFSLAVFLVTILGKIKKKSPVIKNGLSLSRIINLAHDIFLDF